MENKDRLDLPYEIARKAIHISSLSIPLIYWHISRELALLILLPLFAGFFFVDLLKNFVKPVSGWYHRTFDSMLREHELQTGKIQFNGATCIMVSAVILVFFFPKIIAVASFSMVAVSDTFASVVGKTLGRHRFGKKSIEGSIAFFVTAIAVVLFVPGLDWRIGLAMAAAGTVTEAFVAAIGNYRIDDNLTIPIASAALGMICYHLFLPGDIPFLDVIPECCLH
ncbi:MAG: phosphatidate cytidylyltransferase [Chlorobiaceae bacterium]|nr:phosphatidate cytidylyltransferase [Chlorobiaceae bacterium]NTW11237.1 phosphatidate cytidylyltransferase [Chlorobiaceae bacterium]